MRHEGASDDRLRLEFERLLAMTLRERFPGTEWRIDWDRRPVDEGAEPDDLPEAA